MSNFVAAPMRALLGLAMIAGMAAPALADPRIDVIANSAKSRTTQAQVQVADLDMTSNAGMAALNRRIAFAAQDVCGSDQLYSIDAKNDYLRCRRDAIKDAEAQIAQRIATHDASAVRVTGG